MIEIIRTELCTGCSACASICSKKHAIIMESDNEGFLYPKVNKEDCVKCGLCIKVCPMLHTSKLPDTPIAYAANNNDENVRINSSSGGIFTLIAEHVISNDGVVFGVKFDDNFNVIHSQIDDKERLYSIRGAKYVQSNVGDAYSQVKYYLEKGRQVFYSGTPCQVAGLRFYLGKDYDNLLCQDIICQGVASPLAWRSYLDCRIKKCKKGSKVKGISFRSKEQGWKQYKIRINFDSGYIYEKSRDDDNYLKAFMKFLTIRPSCFECKFKGESRESDITLADFWGIENVVPCLDDNKGTSLVLLNTDKGKQYMNELMDRMTCLEVNFQDSIKNNPMYSKSITYNNLRRDFLTELLNNDFDVVAKKYLKESMIAILKRKAKAIFKK